jgi:hypothetical protein
MMQHPQPQEIKVRPSIHAALQKLQMIDMALDDVVVPFEHESCLYRFLILTQFVDGCTKFRNACMKGSM